ncbi:hypothetical protein [Rathayibacter sp. VKM Ac-2858]|uniref:hypothetical protein n=1 Tax=Rathayibacter sp. VKM Ac-2858 TaxID=2739019 RepID=UPI001563F68D|nr:hypothetical protein [Rathayibacter sp. VKM Ac-2858]
MVAAALAGGVGCCCGVDTVDSVAAAGSFVVAEVDVLADEVLGAAEAVAVEAASASGAGVSAASGLDGADVLADEALGAAEAVVIEAGSASGAGVVAVSGPDGADVFAAAAAIGAVAEASAAAVGAVAEVSAAGALPSSAWATAAVEPSRHALKAREAAMFTVVPGKRREVAESGRRGVKRSPRRWSINTSSEARVLSHAATRRALLWRKRASPALRGA